MKLKTFPQGVFLPHHKEDTAPLSIIRIPMPSRVVLPLVQHTGVPLKPLVKKGDIVRRGQKIADVEAFVTAPVHASISGKVAGIEEWAHPTLGKCQAVVIENDGTQEEERKDPLPEDIESLKPDFLRLWVREGGFVGLGGAAFPTHVKLSPPEGKPIDTFILNGAECEPYLTCDHRVMLERAQEMLLGLRIMVRACRAKRAYIGIEDNKKDCIDHIAPLLQDLPFPAEVVPLRTKYPQGSEKHLILAILGREVPPGGLPLDVGVVVNNVQTAALLGRMAKEGLPLVERVITLSGDCLKKRGNLEVPLGVLLEDLVDFCEGFTIPPRKIVMGGPMTGVAQVSLSVPVIKGTSGFLFFARPSTKREYPCIRCGRCVTHCPMRLMPYLLGRLAEERLFAKAESARVLDCIECGSCAYVCPAGIALVHLLKLAKFEVMRRARKGGK
ncbi:MAG: electron transport complex subunit RsxC [Candidatus Caldatribacteriaceae bacterium]